MKCIELEWALEPIVSPLCGGSVVRAWSYAPDTFTDNINTLQLFDVFEITNTFPENMDDNGIIHVNGDLSNDSIGTFYQNMCHWLKNDKNLRSQPTIQIFRYHIKTLCNDKFKI